MTTLTGRRQTLANGCRAELAWLCGYSHDDRVFYTPSGEFLGSAYLGADGKTTVMRDGRVVGRGYWSWDEAAELLLQLEEKELAA